MREMIIRGVTVPEGVRAEAVTGRAVEGVTKRAVEGATERAVEGGDPMRPLRNPMEGAPLGMRLRPTRQPTTR